MIRSILVASHNPDKAVEIRSIFAQTGVEIRVLEEFKNAPEVVEDGNTLEENALKKAREIFDFTEVPTLADDTGLEVDVLNGAPGIFSARYAGENATYDDNVNKLLAAMETIEDQNRTARFRTVVAFYDGANAVTAEGAVEGRILRSRRGNGGFGYDPVFESLETKQTFAEMSLDAKNAISHRGRALRSLYLQLQEQHLIH